MLPGVQPVAAVTGVHPHTPAFPPPPLVSNWVGQLQLIVPPQPSFSWPQSWLGPEVSWLHTFGVQHCCVALLHSVVPEQAHVTVPPQPFENVPH